MISLFLYFIYPIEIFSQYKLNLLKKSLVSKRLYCIGYRPHHFRRNSLLSIQVIYTHLETNENKTSQAAQMHPILLKLPQTEIFFTNEDNWCSFLPCKFLPHRKRFHSDHREFHQSLGRTFSYRTCSRQPDSWAHNADAQELKEGCDKEQRKYNTFDKILHINTI